MKMLVEVVQAFLMDKQTYCARRTVENYKEHLTRFLNFFPEGITLQELTTEHIKEYILELKAAGVRNVSIRAYLRSVKVFCSWLYANEYTDDNIFNRVKLPRSDEALKQPLTIAEVEKIDSVCDPRDQIIVHLMLDAGLRASEVCNLQRSDVDLVNKLIYIHNSKYNKSRVVPLAPELHRLICRYASPDDYLVTSRSGAQLTVNAIKLLFARIKRRTGINRVHAHLLRHTFATSYIVGGGNMEKLRIMLGHSDYNVTKVYLHLAAQYEVVHYPIYQLDAVFFKSGY